jgi:drug/metabolite transporter (DMT)-like permease
MMNDKTTLSRKIFTWMVFAIILDTLVQLTWKKLASKITLDLNPGVLLQSYFKEPFFILIVVLFALQLFNWLRLLSKADLSYVYPMTALSYVTVALCSKYFLGEHLSWLKLSGIGMILIGIYCMTFSNPLSKNS